MIRQSVQNAIKTGAGVVLAVGGSFMAARSAEAIDDRFSDPNVNKLTAATAAGDDVARTIGFGVMALSGGVLYVYGAVNEIGHALEERRLEREQLGQIGDLAISSADEIEAYAN